MRSAIIVANGSSQRYGKDKLSQDILGLPVLRRTVDTFFPLVDELIIVSDNAIYIEQFPFAKVVAGGSTRMQSVQCGLDALSNKSQLVAIHDGARPFVTVGTIQKLFAVASQDGSAVPCLDVPDTVYQISDNSLAVCDRQTLRRVQTPQVFATERIKAAYSKCTSDSLTDDSQVYYKQYGDITLVQGQLTNRKLTLPDDLPQYRSGVGYDVHTLIDGDGLVLGGVKVPFDKKLLGHSDADVLAHAVMDALLGATGQSDIGHLFPDNNDRYKGADSMQLLEEVYALLTQQGFCVVNVSATIACQAPKLAPYTQQMQRNIATKLCIPYYNVNVAATTTEKLGIVGEGKGIACFATCTVLK